VSVVHDDLDDRCASGLTQMLKSRKPKVLEFTAGHLEATRDYAY
jgi:hypothetical protein